jgi:hypothetical protein
MLAINANGDIVLFYEIGWAEKEEEERNGDPRHVFLL